MNVGIVGWRTFTGNGQMNSDLARAAWVTTWLVPEHRHHPDQPALSDCRAVETVKTTQTLERDKVEAWLKTVDAVLAIEHEYIPGLFRLARKCGKPVCLIPMMEWFQTWSLLLEHIDLVWAPTQSARHELGAIADERKAAGVETPWAGHLAGGRWGVWVDDFPFRPRERAKLFLFANGQGGYLGRKGAAVVARAADMARDCRFLLLSQTGDLPPMPANVAVRVGDFGSKFVIYEQGDVFLAPSLWEGFGHQLYECQAAGLPLVTTDGDPMRQAEPLRAIRLAHQDTVDLNGKQVVRYHPDPSALAEICQQLNDRDIGGESLQARRFVEQRYDLRDTLAELGHSLERHLAGGKCTASATPPRMLDGQPRIPVSVVIPCYNAAPWLREALDSVVGQTYSPAEVLVVDDGSTDDSAEIAASYGAPVRVIRQENQGESRARNRGVEEAQGDWIAFLDADDVWQPTKLECQIEVIYSSPADVVCVHTGFYLFGARDYRPRVPSWADQSRFTPQELILQPIVNTSTALVRKGVPVRFPDWTASGEDMIYFAELARHGRLMYVRDQLVGYRSHDAQQHLSAGHLICHAESRLQWLEEQTSEMDIAETHRVRLEIQAQMVKRMKDLKRDRQWQEYWKLRRYLSLLDWPQGTRPRSLDERIYPRVVYHVKDLLTIKS